MSKRWVINTCLVFALLGLIVLQTITYHMSDKNAPSQLITENRATIYLIDQINYQINDQLDSIYHDLEISRSEYRFANQDNYLKPLNQQILDLKLAIENLSARTVNNPEQQELIKNKLQPLMAQNNTTLNKLDVQDNHTLNEQMSNALDEIKKIELAILKKNTVKDETMRRRLSLLIFTGSLLSILAILIFFFLINQFLDRKILAESFSHNQKQLFESILDCMGDGVLVRDMNGQFILQNPAARKIIGDNLEQLQIYLEDGKTEVPEKDLTITKAIQGESVDNTMYFVKSSNYPKGIYVNVSVRPLITKDGQTRGGVAVFSDVTAIKEANDQLEAFNYSVSHDLSAPLRTIVGFSQIILEDHCNGCTPEAHDALNRIIGATKKMKLVIEGLLELSRLKRAEVNKEKVDLSSIVSNIASDLLRIDINRNVNFIIPKNIEVNADPRLLSIVMTNLMSNAYKFTARRPDTIIEFGLIKDNDNKKETYFVRDNGAGFDMRHIDKLFGAFERLHANDEFPGTGIGLATVKHLIDKHAGEIWAQGEVNKGAIFYFTL